MTDGPARKTGRLSPWGLESQEEKMDRKDPFEGVWSSRRK
jgi:hypothetical protein